MHIANINTAQLPLLPQGEAGLPGTQRDSEYIGSTSRTTQQPSVLNYCFCVINCLIAECHVVFLLLSK